MLPDNSYLLQKTGIDLPLIGLYDSPDPNSFFPLVSPGKKGHACVFAFFKAWLSGKTLHLTRNTAGCGGASLHLFHLPTRSRKDFVRFLVEDEGLKSDCPSMKQWADQMNPYDPEHDHIMIGPLKPHSDQFLKTITFLVNPDQLSMLLIGSQYFSRPSDPPPVSVPFGSGCMLLLPLFKGLDIPQAMIGATDLAMRRYLPACVLAFTVTLPMYRNLCRLGRESFLEKGFIKTLLKARKNR